ncbi:hypothetical protein M8756_05865 [Lutimaribacter sp. EGI FJ00015]|uniref:Uncharacterized protein n=1 Tax=Lutimaribacter degradans TaxID=2945989 RepID=A0ACC5ZTG2_9RHOB|nr:hypothetical protein [Lutimaribacter sp. EGI FJ00013]MCM2561463.1 hypothetical protein [Lutimaribacter sp. EGI FJ00013]MCO0612826.1 hypothetical protein [Lutimaribacter sp. EGI FJ00015]MCO0635484.1 hypothetical protein [Lutimaribacter sp. EGI FJ00014]
MFKRSWIISVTLGLAVFISGLWFSWSVFSAYQQRHADERATAAQYYSDTTQHGPRACRSIVAETGVLDWLTCLADNISADGSVKQSEYDLKAQQDMAAWAFGMLVATVWLTVITLFGVFFVWRTLLATQAMARDAREIGEAQVRAYISPTHGEYEIGPRGLKVRVYFRNYGQSPGRDVAIKGTAHLATPATPPRYPDDTVQRVTPEARNSWGMVPASGVDDTFLHWDADIIGPDATVAIISGRGAFHIEGTLVWSDVFGSHQSINVFLWSDGGRPTRDSSGLRGNLCAHSRGKQA